MRPMNDSSACPGFRQTRPSRRELLRVGALGWLGLSLPRLLRAAERGPRKARAKSVILLHQFGGPSQTDTFDMKPEAPEQYRGIYKPMPSRCPGLMVCDQLPNVAR